MAKTEWDKVAPEMQSIEHVTPLAYTIAEAVKATGITRTRLYEELKAGRLTAKKSGRRTLILRASIETWLENLENYNSVNSRLSSIDPTMK